MDVGQALINERTFDCVVSVYVCAHVCVLHFLCFICYSLDGGLAISYRSIH